MDIVAVEATATAVEAVTAKVIIRYSKEARVLGHRWTKNELPRGGHGPRGVRYLRVDLAFAFGFV